MKSTKDLYLQHSPAKETDPQAARKTLELLEQYGLEVPPNKWQEALSGVKLSDQKLFVSQEECQRTAEPLPEDDQTVFVRTSAVDPLLALSHDQLLEKQPYFFAALQKKTDSVHKKLRACKRFDKAQKILRNHFYSKTEVSMPENFYFYSNLNLGCGVVCYAEGNTFISHWFLNN